LEQQQTWRRLARASMSPENRESYLLKKCLAASSKVASMTTEELEVHRAKQRASESARCASMTPEQCEQHRASSCAAVSLRHSKMTPENWKQHYSRKRDKGEGQTINFHTKVTNNISSLNFKGFEQDPETAALLYYANSGHTTYWPMHFLLDEKGNIIQEQFDRI
jgi:hypothetical protein